jgi:hypothetical protein
MEKEIVAFTAKQRTTMAKLVGGSVRKSSPEAVVSRLEQRIQNFGRKTAKEERRPAIEAYARAARIARHAIELERELTGVNQATERHLLAGLKKSGPRDIKDGKGLRSRKQGRRCLKNVASAAVHVSAAARYAASKACAAAFVGERTIDAQFRALCDGVAFDWNEIVGRPLPDLEYRRKFQSDGSFVPGAEMTVGQHPLWLVLDAVGIKIDAYILDEVIAAARQRASARLRRQEWRRSVPQ